MKVAFVYDRVNKWGGAERVLLALHKIWPQAPLYTAVYDKNQASWADIFEVKPSFLQYIPLAKNHHEWLPWLTPMAFESFSFDAFDVVISVTSAEAKNIITKPGTIHICYCLTPTRYLWSAHKDYERSGVAGKVLRALSPTLKKWDLVAASRPDYYFAISETVKQRIQTYYHRDVRDVIYPPVDVKKFNCSPRGDYFLTVARLVEYKRVDIVIDAFNQLGWPLVVIGVGREKNRLMRRAKENIRFIGEVTETELISYYQQCRAFVYAGEEDFGIAVVEAQAAGKPVVAYKRGGTGETVVPGRTGVLFEDQSSASLVGALESFDQQLYDSGSCIKNARRYSTDRFEAVMKHAVETVYNKKYL